MLEDHLNANRSVICTVCRSHDKPAPTHGVTAGYFLQQRGWVELQLPGTTDRLWRLLLCRRCAAEYRPCFKMVARALRRPTAPRYAQAHQVVAELERCFADYLRKLQAIARELDEMPAQRFDQIRELLLASLLWQEEDRPEPAERLRLQHLR